MPVVFEEAGRSEPTPKKEETPRVRGESEYARMRPLTCFAVSPEGVRFESQESNEDVVLFLRQHLVVLAPRVLLVLALLIAPPIVFPFLVRFLTLPILLPFGYVIVGTLFWYLMTFGVALMGFLRWFFNIYIVTNQRIVDIDFAHLLYKEFSEARLTKIQDVTYRTGGILAALFNYGNVYIQTAGELPNFEFIAVSNPERIVQIIGELTSQTRGGSPV